jgi:chromate transporter
LHVLFGEIITLNTLGLGLEVPMLASIRPASLILTLAALNAVFRFHLGVMTILAGCSVLGLLYGLAGGIG